MNLPSGSSSPYSSVVPPPAHLAVGGGQAPRFSGFFRMASGEMFFAPPSGAPETLSIAYDSIAVHVHFKGRGAGTAHRLRRWLEEKGSGCCVLRGLFFDAFYPLPFTYRSETRRRGKVWRSELLDKPERIYMLRVGAPPGPSPTPPPPLTEHLRQ